MQYTRIVATVLAAAALAVACGPESASRPKTSNTQGNDYNTVVARGSDPRTGDPTAANAAPGPAPVRTSSPTITSTTPVKDNEPSGASAAVEEKEPPKRIGARHVLVQWMGSDKAGASVVRSKEQARAIIEEVHRRAKAGEDFARLAVEYSDEPGAGNRGGSLGRFGKGMMVGQFETVAFKLKVGEVSEIVETGFGYHVIQRTE